jgi:NAD(P)-dependent dehydrogenase (short-subunit alcohol dehydrogenase family)
VNENPKIAGVVQVLIWPHARAALAWLYDKELRMAKALVVGASGGIGQALVRALTAAGREVVSLSRSGNGLDVTDEASVIAALAALQGPFDTVFIATGAWEIGPHGPEQSLRAVVPAGLLAQFQTNAMGPILVLKHLVAHLPKDAPCRVGILSARVGSIGDNGLGGWYSYRMAKAALNQLVHTAAIELGRSHSQAILALLHPGTVATDFTAKYAGNHSTVASDKAAQNLIRVLAGLAPAQSGGFYDWAGQAVPW